MKINLNIHQGLMFQVECDFCFEVTQKIFLEFSVYPIKLYHGLYTNGEQKVIIDDIENLWQSLALLWYHHQLS